MFATHYSYTWLYTNSPLSTTATWDPDTQYGSDVGQINTYEVNLPSGRKDLEATFRAPDAAADNGFTYYLVNPSGKLVNTAHAKSAATADLYTLHPVAGLWQIDVVLDMTVSGKEFTQTVNGTVTETG